MGQRVRGGGKIKVMDAVKKYGTTKDKLRKLVADGLLTAERSEFDRRVKLLSVDQLDELLRKETSVRNGK